MQPTPAYKDEWYCEWFTCTNCEKTWIAEDFKFCPSCGVAINWNKED